MASRLKEDEKNERIIRGLLKLPENRRCINCNSLVCFINLMFVHFFGCMILFVRVINLTNFLVLLNYELVINSTL